MTLTVTFSPPSLDVTLQNPVAREYVGFDIYDGDYTVDPSAHEDIVLPTKNKAMLDDVTVNKIYYAEVSNPADGVTVYIAEQI